MSSRQSGSSSSSSDPKRTGRIPIRDLLSSQILPELYELRQEQPLEASEAASNWFSMQSALKVYGAYLELDVDQNGMLSRNELSRFGSSMLTDVFIDRVFEEYQTYRDSETGEREMDYKTRGGWVPAQVDHFNEEFGVYALDVQPYAKPEDVRLAGFEEPLQPPCMDGRRAVAASLDDNAGNSSPVKP